MPFIQGTAAGKVALSPFLNFRAEHYWVRPKYLSLDNDPLYRFNRWAPELEAMMINPIYSIPLTPISHPFLERLIGTTRREYLDQLFF